MSSDVIIEAGGPSEAAAAARLHHEQLTDSFLATLGPRFLHVLYRRIAADPAALLLVARSGGAVVGFVSGTEDTSQLYRDFVRHDGLRAVAAAAPGMLRHPRAVLETLQYARTGHDTVEIPPAEVLSMAVSPSQRGQGIGARFLLAMQEEFRRRGVVTARLTVASDNPAIGMYHRCGFLPLTRTEVHRGRSSELLVWR